MIESLHTIINKSRDLGAVFSEARYLKRDLTRLISQNNEFSEIKTGIIQGLGVRVIVNGRYGFAATSSESSLEQMVRQAIAIAKARTDPQGISIPEMPSHQESISASVSKDPADYSIEEKMNMLRNAEAAMQGKNVSSTRAIYQDFADVRGFVNSAGTELIIKDAKTEFIATTVVKEDGQLSPGVAFVSGTGGMEILEKKPPEDIARKALAEACDLMGAPVVPGGSSRVVLDHELVGLLAHEAVGHTAEADWMESGSFLKGKLGQKEASELITLVDAPAVNNASGWCIFDDEGTRGREIRIIENGIVNDFMNNLELAERLSLEPSGNARAWSYQDIPIIRMRNTFIKSGDFSFEELIADTKNGFFLVGAEGGQADKNGEFMFGTRKALEIKNGELSGKAFKGASISGNAFEVLKSVDGIGKDFKMDMGAGYCGKLQPAKVDGGGGMVRCSVLVGGT